MSSPVSAWSENVTQETHVETLAQERLVHFLTIEMGNLCGQPTASPGGARASSEVRQVTCDACLAANVDRIGAIGESLIRSGCASDPADARDWARD